VESSNTFGAANSFGRCKGRGTPLIFLPMSVILVLLGASLLVAGGFLVAFLWSVKSGQMDDNYGPSVRMLFDDKPKESAK
jgi:cbb3-type cytochrome oxidase maturation protein